MPVRTILRLGDPRLRNIARPVEHFPSRALDGLVTDLFDTMRSADGAGLAAPQIGVAQRVMVFSVEVNPRYPEAEPVPATVLINPEFEVVDREQVSGWEGCLSVPGLRGWVPRHRAIRYRGFDPGGSAIEREVDGFHSVVFQHEYDHLDGVLYPDRIVDRTRFGFEAELAAAGTF